MKNTTRPAGGPGALLGLGGDPTVDYAINPAPTPEQHAGMPAVERPHLPNGRSTRQLSHEALTVARNLPPAAIWAEVQAFAATCGYVVCGKCRECGSPISGAESLHSGLGRVCRRWARKAAREQVTR
ncbi:hypothetical protein GCM10027405_31430 [Arthrobacter alkaliphilus]